VTLSALLKRGLIEAVGTMTPDGSAVDRATASERKPVEIPSRMENLMAERKASEVKKKRVTKTGAARSAPVKARAAPRVEEVKIEQGEPEVAEYVPQIGQKVWHLDWQGKRESEIYRVDHVDGDDVQLSVWSGHSFKRFGDPQSPCSLVPLTEKELAAAIKTGMPQD
jgi:hypothetical protein